MGKSDTSAAFRNVKAKGRVSLQCEDGDDYDYYDDIYILHNFKNSLQAAQAYAAAGNGALASHWVADVGYCWDYDTMNLNNDGIPPAFNQPHRDVWYYDTNTLSLSQTCSQSQSPVQEGYKCVDELIQRGWDDYWNPTYVQVNPSWSNNAGKATWKDLGR